jgi:low temperature requirement protein LtrA
MTGMALVFATCWWYFDGAGATEPRSIRSRADAVRFHVWSYAHLPLYLGIAVAGVGLERIITTATEAPLPGGEAAILAGASLTVAVSMVAIGAMRQPAKNPTL